SSTTAEQDARRGIAHRTGEAAGVQHDEVGALTGLERAELLVEVQRARAVTRRHEEGVARGERPLAVQAAREQRSDAGFLKSIQTVVARRPVRAEADGHAAPAQSHDICDAGAEFEVR